MGKALSSCATVLLISGLLGLSAQYPGTGTYETLKNGFQHPPPGSWPFVYDWWLGGYVDTLRLKEELTGFKNAGISGFTIFEIGSLDTVFVKSGPAFLSEESLKTIKYAIDEAGRLGLEVGLNTSSSWNAGGSWIPPKFAAKSVFYAKTEAGGGKELKIKLPFPDISETDAWGKQRMIQYDAGGKPAYYKEIAVLAVPAGLPGNHTDTSDVVDISRFFDTKTEMLQWEAPPGNWIILRYICSNSGENLVLPSRYSAGPTMDHYDAEATEFHFNYVIRKLESVLGDLQKTALKSLYMASYEEKALTWTETLPGMFKKINGYSVEKFLPTLFEDDFYKPELRSGFKMDYQRTLSELMITNFYEKSREICNQHGLKNNCEAGGPGLPLHKVPVEPIKALGAVDIPRGEFWINHSQFNESGIDIMRVVKEVSAASHIYNRGVAEMEAFTTFQHWQEGPAEMKPVGDRAFCEGMNKVVVHGSTHNPAGTGFPGIVYRAGTHYNDKRVWWPKVRPFNEYLARISFVLQEADFVADVLYYYGDTIPNYAGHKNSRFTAGPGYDYEIINTEKLKELSVQNKKLVLPSTGAQFRILALSNETGINPEVLIKLDDLVRKGAVIMGSKGQKVHTGIYSGVEASAILEKLGVGPDFSYAQQEFSTLDYTHYSAKDADFYFVRNTTAEWISRNCSFRQRDRVPEIWDPVSGNIAPVSIYEQQNGMIRIPLAWAPFGSFFVVFREGPAGVHATQVSGYETHPPLLQYTADGVCFWEEGRVELTGQDQSKILDNLVDIKVLEDPWNVYFPEDWGAPEKAVFPELKSWTESENEGIRYFSGIARYEKTFDYEFHPFLPEKTKIFLDLGDLSEVGEVWLDEHPLGITWTKPYRYEITDILRPGRNKLKIEIANTWSNRIVGDALKGETYTRTNIRDTDIRGASEIHLPWKEVPLIRSGLFGPVRIMTIHTIIPGSGL